MSVPNTEEVNTSTRGDETRSVGSHEPYDEGKASTSSSAPLTSEKKSQTD